MIGKSDLIVKVLLYAKKHCVCFSFLFQFLTLSKNKTKKREKTICFQWFDVFFFSIYFKSKKYLLLIIHRIHENESLSLDWYIQLLYFIRPWSCPLTVSYLIRKLPTTIKSTNQLFFQLLISKWNGKFEVVMQFGFVTSFLLFFWLVSGWKFVIHVIWPLIVCSVYCILYTPSTDFAISNAKIIATNCIEIISWMLTCYWKHQT